MFFAPALRSRHFAPRVWDAGFERFYNEAFANPVQRSLQFEHDDKSWTLSLDVPGLTREELDIAIDSATVRIDSKAEAKRQVHVAYELPQEIDVAGSEAKLENGVLMLKLGKKQAVNAAQSLLIQ